MPAKLGIYVVGPRYGESIILHLPDDGVGVIDSFADRGGQHPLIPFLAKQFPTLTHLRFLAITHPHADHCFRAADVLDRFSAEEVWIFRPFPAGQIQNYYEALRRHGTKEAIEDALELPVGSVADSLLQLYHCVEPAVNRGALTYRALAKCPHFTICAGQIRVHFLTPGNRLQFTYAGDVEQAARAIFDNGPSLLKAKRLPAPDHNLASGGILVEYGQTRALLMADAECPLWAECLTDDPPPELCKPVHFLKASHHGSDNGYHGNLYQAITDPVVTLAVVTPFNKGRQKLPTKSGVEAIRPHVRELYCTNRSVAETSTGLQWEGISSPPLPRVPSRWAAMIGRQPILANLLVPQAGLAAIAGSPPSIPPEWATDAHRNADLWRLIHPQFRQVTAFPPFVESHMVAAYYDENGQLLDLRIGDGAGRLK